MAEEPLCVCIDLYAEGRPVCDTAGGRATFYSMCNVVTWVEGCWEVAIA